VRKGFRKAQLCTSRTVGPSKARVFFKRTPEEWLWERSFRHHRYLMVNKKTPFALSLSKGVEYQIPETRLLARRFRHHRYLIVNKELPFALSLSKGIEY
jgi:hypothetical protein